jgi:hypothetical protein
MQKCAMEQIEKPTFTTKVGPSNDMGGAQA